MSRTVHVDMGDRAYAIRIGRDLPISPVPSAGKGARALLVTDSNVGPLYGDRCEKLLREAGLEPGRSTLPAGEATKSIDSAGDLYHAALELGLDRASVIVALGGGMVGDLAGFVAGTFLRGIRYVQVPTTLLAMVDSSVGGKTAVNLAEGKNLVGVFHQPLEVVADLATLETLPEREYRSGLAEVVKYGVIWDAALFEELETNAGAVLKRDPDLLEAVITRCCEIKAEVVAMDERESGVRAILNFGHTLGHALEQNSGYGWLHGEAVAWGMTYAARLSVLEKGLTEGEYGRLTALLGQFGLPTDLQSDAKGIGWDDLRRAMSADKKARDGVVRFVLCEAIGSVVFGCQVEEDRLVEAFTASRSA